MENRPLKIAIVAPIDWRTPPRQAGSRELMASVLTEGLVTRGHHVTLFATADSVTKARLLGICPRPLMEDPALEPVVWNILHLAEVFARAAEFDVIHCHGDATALAYAELVDVPVILTIHQAPPPRYLPLFHRFARCAAYVAINEAGKRAGIPYSATIHPGIALEEYRLSPKGEYLLCVGRIAPNRGLEETIEAATQTPFPVVVGGLVEDKDYFETFLDPLIAEGKISYLGPISREQRSEIYGKALALVHLSDRPQAFRYSFIEAMACGTPVIAKNTAGNAEIIGNKRTGFLVKTLEEIIEAIFQVASLDRRKIRQHVLDHFSQEGMIVQYLRIYQAAMIRAKAARKAAPR